MPKYMPLICFKLQLIGKMLIFALNIQGQKGSIAKTLGRLKRCFLKTSCTLDFSIVKRWRICINPMLFETCRREGK